MPLARASQNVRPFALTEESRELRAPYRRTLRGHGTLSVLRANLY
jgi:hypothetical protein